jgi:hypothetical protein
LADIERYYTREHRATPGVDAGISVERASAAFDQTNQFDDAEKIS